MSSSRPKPKVLVSPRKLLLKRSKILKIKPTHKLRKTKPTEKFLDRSRSNSVLLNFGNKKAVRSRGISPSRQTSSIKTMGNNPKNQSRNPLDIRLFETVVNRQGRVEGNIFSRGSEKLFFDDRSASIFNFPDEKQFKKGKGRNPYASFFDAE